MTSIQTELPLFSRRVRVKDISGQRFGRLIAIKEADRVKNGPRWLCRCDCGKETVVQKGHLKSGHSRSCGCLILREQRHKTGVYWAWKNMHRRCYEVGEPCYEGITVCAEWSDFQAFFKDMGQKPSKDHSLDRIDGAKGYYKENCRWATDVVQNANRKTVPWLEIDGVKKPAYVWARELGIGRETLLKRFYPGITSENCLKRGSANTKPRTQVHDPCLTPQLQT